MINNLNLDQNYLRFIIKRTLTLSLDQHILRRNVHWNSDVARLFVIIFDLQQDSIALQTAAT